MCNSGQLLAVKKVVVLYDLVHDAFGFCILLTAYTVDAMPENE